MEFFSFNAPKTNSEFVNACRLGNLNALKSIFQCSGNIDNLSIHAYYEGFIESCDHNNTSVLDYLITDNSFKSILENPLNKYISLQAFLNASKLGSIKTVDFLLDNNPHGITYDFNRAMAFAYSHHCMEMVKHLLDTNNKDCERTAFLFAHIQKDVDMLYFLIVDKNIDNTLCSVKKDIEYVELEKTQLNHLKSSMNYEQIKDYIDSLLIKRNLFKKLNSQIAVKNTENALNKI